MHEHSCTVMLLTVTETSPPPSANHPSTQPPPVELNLGLVKGIVSGYVKSMANGSAVYFVKKDMVQEATVGLIKAVEKFDPTKGFRFATYAQWWVRKYLNECLQNQNRLVKIPVYLAHRVSRVSWQGESEEGTRESDVQWGVCYGVGE